MHTHGHDHHHHGSVATGLKRAFVVTLLFAAVEAVGGVLSHSMALISDAAHMIVDASALGLALFAARIALRPRSSTHTFGYGRAEILAAAVSGGALMVAACGILVEAIERLREPVTIQARMMGGVAVFGLLANLGAAYFLHGDTQTSLNSRAAWLHVMADAAGSVATIIASIVILRGGSPRVDSVASIVIAILIVYGAFRLLREAATVLMEQTPPGVDVVAIERTIRTVPGVRDVHDLHVWRISDGFPMATAHVVLDGAAHGVDVARDVAKRVHDAHGIDHVTIQPEVAVPAEAPIELARARPR